MNTCTTLSQSICTAPWHRLAGGMPLFAVLISKYDAKLVLILEICLETYLNDP